MWLARRVWGSDPPTPARDPFRFFMFAVIGTISLFAHAFQDATPPALAAAPGILAAYASWGIGVGSLLVPVAICLRGNDYRLVLEQIGLVLAGFGLLAYGVAVLNLNGWNRAWLPASFCFGSALGSVGTYVKLWWYQRKPWERR